MLEAVYALNSYYATVGSASVKLLFPIVFMASVRYFVSFFVDVAFVK